MNFMEIHMKIVFKQLLLILILTTTLKAQEDSAKGVGSSLYRFDKPIAIKISFEGIGIDISVGKIFEVEVTTLLVYNNIKFRYLILQSNATPFIGLGYGKFLGGFGGNAVNNWYVGMVRMGTLL
jgi:hypothetical protein